LDPYSIDKIIGVCVCRLNDLVGSDIGLHVGKNFVESFPERVYVSQLIPLLNAAKRLGEKSGSGFYKVSQRQ
jgi:enoyl-CoA hydratase/3-hydroxyacyl-CoA dehydrogenase